MENFKDAFCMLCLGPVKFENSEIVDEHTKNVLDILLLKPSLEEDKQLICSECSTKLFAAFDFKVTCINTEDCIFPYVHSETEPLSDLKEIYIKEKESELHNEVPEDQKVCRLCMQLVSDEVVPIEKVDAKCINRYIPELNFSYTKDPVICKTCHDSLHVHSIFLRTCLYAEEKIKCLSDKKIKTEPIDSNSDEINSDSNAADEALFKDNRAVKVSVANTDTSGDGPDAYRSCDKCDYAGKSVGHLMKHLLVHATHNDMGMYNCDRCDYATANKHHLVSHQLIHRTLSDAPVYKCAECSYETIYKIHLQKHQLVHAPRVFKCDKCEYEGRLRYDLVKHKIVHREASEAEMYKCYACSYRTRHKANIRSHCLTHTEPAGQTKLYECGECDYVTKYKCSLKRHQLRHRDPSEVEMQRCDKCRFQSKFKGALKKHALRHERPS